MYTDPSSVAVELGRELTPSEVAQVKQWIDRVEARISARIPDLAERIGDTDFFAVFSGVVVDVVARKARNPEGFRSERIDDYYYDRGAQSTDLSLTADEWAELLPELGATGAFSVRPSFDSTGCRSWLF